MGRAQVFPRHPLRRSTDDIEIELPINSYILHNSPPVLIKIVFLRRKIPLGRRPSISWEAWAHLDQSYRLSNLWPMQWSRVATCLHTCLECLTKNNITTDLWYLETITVISGGWVVSSWDHYALETCVVMVIVTNRDQRSRDITCLETIITTHYRHNGGRHKQQFEYPE